MNFVYIILIVVSCAIALVAAPWLIGSTCKRCGAKRPRIIRTLVACMLSASICQLTCMGLSWVAENWLGPMLGQPIILIGMAASAIAVLHLCLFELGIHSVRVLWKPGLLIFLAVILFDFAMISIGTMPVVQA